MKKCNHCFSSLLTSFQAHHNTRVDICVFLTATRAFDQEQSIF